MYQEQTLAQAAFAKADTAQPNPFGYKISTSEVPSVVQDIATEVLRLRDAIDFANERLSKVLSPEYGDPKPGANPTPVQSPIRDLHAALAEQIDRLNALVARVEA